MLLPYSPKSALWRGSAGCGSALPAWVRAVWGARARWAWDRPPAGHVQGGVPGSQLTPLAFLSAGLELQPGRAGRAELLPTARREALWIPRPAGRKRVSCAPQVLLLMPALGQPPRGGFPGVPVWRSLWVGILRDRSEGSKSGTQAIREAMEVQNREGSQPPNTSHCPVGS